MIKELARLWVEYRDIYPFKERVNRSGEVILRGLAHRMPQRLAYWVYIDQGVRNLKDNDVVPEVPYTVILQRMSKD